MLGFQALGRLALGQIGAPPGIDIEVGAFTLTGNVAALKTAIIGGVGAFTLSGQDATLTYVSGTAFPAAVGSFTLTGVAAGLDLAMSGGTGAFTLSGQDAALPVSMPAAVGTFALSGPSTTLARDLILYATPTVITGSTDYFLFAPLGAVAFGRADVDEELATTFALTGIDSTGTRAAGITAETGTFTLSGVAADLTATVYPVKIRAFPRVGRGARSTARGNQPIRVFAATGHGANRRAFGG